MSFMERLLQFVFFYPFFMALFWSIGASIFAWRLERAVRRPDLDGHPKVSILIPCHNEEMAIAEVVRAAAASRYPTFDIVVVNDASTDSSAAILDGLLDEIEGLRVVHLARNLGKAMALKLGTMATDAEYLMCIDGDALLHEDAIEWMVAGLERNPRVGVVTGNPRVLNRTTLVARVQVGEYSAIVGMIKRTQRLLGRVYTVSGVCACFRRRAVHDVGYWSSDTVTEDVDISWKLQLGYWGILYEPRALCWILVPETVHQLWRQRLRWAQGGIEAAIRHRREISDWKKRRMWPVFIELMVSTGWSYAVLLVFLAWATTQLFPGFLPAELEVANILPGWTGALLALVCLVQFTAGLALDSRYEGRGLLRQLFWAIWYPALYWVITAGAAVVAVPLVGMGGRRTRHAIWRSPDR